MRFGQHAILSCTIAIVYWFIGWVWIGPQGSPLNFISLFCSSLPDVDLKTVIGPPEKNRSKHRHWFWHGSFIPMIVFFLGFTSRAHIFSTGTFCVVYAFHLIGDLKPGKVGKTGPYLIFKRRGDRMSRRNTDTYLALSALLCLIASVFAMTLAKIYKG
jgi:uncharacterized membrane protein YfcA